MKKKTKNEELLEKILDLIKQLKIADPDVRKDFYESFFPIKEKYKKKESKEIVQALLNYAMFGTIESFVIDVEPFNW